jgi:hypothetical protein
MAQSAKAEVPLSFVLDPRSVADRSKFDPLSGMIE